MAMMAMELAYAGFVNVTWMRMTTIPIPQSAFPAHIRSIGIA
jgi:hypothetical protein